MYEDITPEVIKNTILSGVSGLDTREGSFLSDISAPVAYEIWKIYDALNALIPIAFVDETSGEFIDKRAGEYGIVRKPGLPSTVTLRFAGATGTTIPKNTIFSTESGIEFSTTQSVTLADGTADVTAISVDVGATTNVSENKITLQQQAIPGLDTVTNPQAATGGADVESDEALLARYLAFLRRPPTSGNAYQYEQWALECEGVGAAKITPLANGPGTVGVLIVGMDKQPVENDVVQKCAAHIESVRPIGAGVTVSSAVALTINVSTTLELTNDAVRETVVDAIEEAISAYLKEISFVSSEVKISQIGAIILNVPGVVDYTSLTLNGGTGNVEMADNQVPVLGEVTIN